MVEHSLRMRGARGSIPLISTDRIFERKYKGTRKSRTKINWVREFLGEYENMIHRVRV